MYVYFHQLFIYLMIIYLFLFHPIINFSFLFYFSHFNFNDFFTKLFPFLFIWTFYLELTFIFLILHSIKKQSIFFNLFFLAPTQFALLKELTMEAGLHVDWDQATIITGKYSRIIWRLFWH
jgi:hypothetical protein